MHISHWQDLIQWHTEQLCQSVNQIVAALPYGPLFLKSKLCFAKWQIGLSYFHLGSVSNAENIQFSSFSVLWVQKKNPKTPKTKQQQKSQPKPP